MSRRLPICGRGRTGSEPGRGSGCGVGRRGRIRPARWRGAGAVDRGGLENRCTFWVPRVRIPPSPPLQNRTANAGRSRFYACRGGEGLKQIALRADDADLAVCDLDALGERAEVVAAIAAAVDPDPLACGPGESLDHCGVIACWLDAFQHRGGALGVGLRLVADRLEACDALLQRRVVEIGDAGLDGVIEPLQPQVGFGGALVQFGDVLAAALGALLPAVKDARPESPRAAPAGADGRRCARRRGCPASPSGSTGPCSRSRPAGL